MNQGHDSLMSVNKIQGFIWDKHGPKNYSTDEIRWPRTQDIQPIFEVNSGVFIVSHKTATSRQDRIGEKPYLMETSKKVSYDIDWQEDFELAEIMYNH